MNNLRWPNQRESEILDFDVALTYKMCPIREGQKREDFVNLLVLVLKDASNRKLYPRANLHVLSCCGFDNISKTIPGG
jgi:hypothetical protein